ncbi:hypothetical protein GQ54DRAFT_172837 [Martensiomyces pterosporus]|nr:hypothetical protein GQ54DRAFT_172837 [Martensiomyces pterosporus]
MLSFLACCRRCRSAGRAVFGWPSIGQVEITLRLHVWAANASSPAACPRRLRSRIWLWNKGGSVAQPSQPFLVVPALLPMALPSLSHRSTPLQNSFSRCCPLGTLADSGKSAKLQRAACCCRWPFVELVFELNAARAERSLLTRQLQGEEGIKVV